MIYNSDYSDWKKLQEDVSKILNDVGIFAETNKTVITPRGKVEVDVFGIDKNSIDEIKYVIECKSWKTRVPKTVAHSFMTVMAETGANIGYIISNNGLQKGAQDYLKNTNITSFTFEQFENRYFEKWFKKYFCKQIDTFSSSFIEYTEIFNNRRSHYYSKLSKKLQSKFDKLFNEYQPFSVPLITLIAMHLSANLYSMEDINAYDLNKFKQFLQTGMEFNFTATNYGDLLIEVEKEVKIAVYKFNNIFGEDIFER